VKRQVHAVIDALIRGRTPRLQKTSIVAAAEQLPPFGPAEGRQGAEHALLRAAMQLFCERVDVGVSGRELSKLADVNYGLIHHYFGSKEAVFDQAFVRLHDHYVKDMMSVPSYERSQRMTQHESFLRGWAARELSGSALPSIELKGMRALLQQLIKRRDIDRRNSMAMAAARAQSYAVTAMLLGWTLCRPLLSAALQTDESTLLGYLLAIQDQVLKEKFHQANV
jgi:AcrR family transcriptional regulator